MKKVNWGIIGLGKIANIFAEAFKYSVYGQLTGISSTTKENILKFKDQYKLNKDFCFNSYEELLRSKDIDIVYIALPNSLHYEWILKCINYKKKILVEKPATLNFYEIKKIKDNYYNKEIFFSEGFMYRFHPQTLKLIELLKSNKIGKLVSMETYFGKDILTSKNFLGFKKRKKINKENRLYNKSLGGGAILDLGCYTVSLSTFVASFVSKFDYNNVQVIDKKKKLIETGVDIDSYAELVFDNGFKSKVGVSFAKNLGKKTKIVGTEGEIIIEDIWHANPALIYLKQKTTNKIEINTDKNIFSYEIDFISKCILEKKLNPEFPGLKLEDTVGNMKILDTWLN